MGWVIAGLFLLFLMLRFPAFGAVVLGIAVLGGLYLYSENERSERRTATREKEARSFERMKLLQIEDGRLYLDGYLSRVTGLATNTSDYQTIRRFEIKVLVYDCPDRTAENCAVVGDQAEELYVEIPPKQKRAFDTGIAFRGLPKLAPGKWSWSFFVAAVHVN